MRKCSDRTNSLTDFMGALQIGSRCTRSRRQGFASNIFVESFDPAEVIGPSLRISSISGPLRHSAQDGDARPENKKDNGITPVKTAGTKIKIYL